MSLSRTAIYLIVFAALNGLIAVVTGSLAAHGIETMAPVGEKAVSWFYDGSDFQMKMAFGIVFVARTLQRRIPLHHITVVKGGHYQLFSGSLESRFLPCSRMPSSVCHHQGFDAFRGCLRAQRD